MYMFEMYDFIFFLTQNFDVMRHENNFGNTYKSFRNGKLQVSFQYDINIALISLWEYFNFYICVHL